MIGVSRKFAIVCFCFAVVSPAIVISLSAQEQASASQQPISLTTTEDQQLPDSAKQRSMRVAVNMVLVPVSVTDVMDRPVMDMRKDDFALFQDDQQQNLEYFSTEDAPVSAGLVLDLSKSMSNKFEIERQAVNEFFKNANAQDDYFVITFSDHPKLVTDTTQSIDTIESNLGLQTPDGNTALFDAIAEGADRMRLAQHRRKALLIISDGGDNHSRHRLSQIKRSLQDSDVEVYAIGIFDTGPFKTVEEALGKKWLSQITDATGGRTITVDNKDKVPEAAAAISREIRSRYVLGYRPDGLRSSTRRKIRVQLTAGFAKKNVHAYYKTGYVTAEAPAQPFHTN